MPIIFLWNEIKIRKFDEMLLIKLFFSLLKYKKTPVVYTHAERTWPKILLWIIKKCKE